MILLPSKPPLWNTRGTRTEQRTNVLDGNASTGLSCGVDRMPDWEHQAGTRPAYRGMGSDAEVFVSHVSCADGVSMVLFIVHLRPAADDAIPFMRIRSLRIHHLVPRLVPWHGGDLGLAEALCAGRHPHPLPWPMGAGELNRSCRIFRRPIPTRNDPGMASMADGRDTGNDQVGRRARLGLNVSKLHAPMTSCAQDSRLVRDIITSTNLHA